MKFGLIGEHLSHSYSKEIHSAISDYDYDLVELKPDELDLFFEKKNFFGINVTIPYKEKVIKYLDCISDEARKIGTVNTVINRDGRLFGYNTDYSGFIALIKRNDIDFSGKKVLILGTGGTSKTVYFASLDMGAKEILKVSRTKKDGTITYSEAENYHSNADIIVNTTPVGMYPNDEKISLDLSKFKKLSAVIDVIYNPVRTDFVIRGRENGIISVGGSYMLCSQAVSSSSLFTGLSIENDITEKTYQNLLKSKLNIVLIGMPTSGKTSVGKLISEKTGRKFYDSDELITEKENKKITEIFSQYGEGYFRKAERNIIYDLSKETGSVISVGGGTVLDSENAANLKKNGVLFFVDRALEKLTPKEDRPLSDNADSLKRLFAERYEIYKNSADFIIDGNGTIEETADKIIEVFKYENFDY